ncbi:MAG: hypothetical protein Aurels2KO_40020 [Aureliella sp.]
MLVPAVALGLGTLSLQTASAQSTQWQPAPLQAAPAARSLGSAAMEDSRYLAGSRARSGNGRSISSGASRTQPRAASESSGEQLGSGVVLRWCKSKNAPEQPSSSISAAAAFKQPQPVEHTVNRTNYPVSRASGSTRRGIGNPLRSGVQPAAYQDRVDPFQSRPADAAAPLQGGAPQLPDVAAPGLGLPDLGPPPISGPEIVAPDLSAPDRSAPEMSIPNSGADMQGFGEDPLGTPESAPAPGGVSPDVMQDVAPEPSPFDRQGDYDPDMDDDIIDVEPGESQLGLPSCTTMRERMNSRPISGMQLNPSPKYGNEGRLDYSDNERARKAFADTTKTREWYDYLGRHVATGRFVNMKNNMIYIDDVGKISTIHYLDLSDRDTEYVSLAWKIPGRCGTGYEPFEERNFIPTQFQWTASGLCHKPAYFEQPQLERYGHSVGPVLQPLISSARFFTDIAILPYKMGIHPPNECQYSLGYIRPGNCAPYMVQPFPWSLRGAAVQAGVVTGVGALVP